MTSTRRAFIKTAALGVAGSGLFISLNLPAARAKPLAAPRADEISRFGLLFPNLPKYSVADGALMALAETMRDRAAGSPLGDNLFHNSQGVVTDTISAGLTYLGQFLDHDLTKDNTPLTEASPNVEAVQNFRQPALNLDSVYDGAPMVGPRFLIEVNQHGVIDYPRDSRGFARIPDPRNDENLLLVPIHLGLMRFHNVLLDKGQATTFEQAQQLTRWHYQWVIVTELLPALIGQPQTDSLIELRDGKKPKIKAKFFKTGTPPRVMPVEFAVAAYRIHTLVRNNYNIQSGRRLGIFNTTPDNLLGFRPVPAHLKMQPDLFFRTPTSPAFDGPGAQAGPLSFNVSRRIDASISPQLYNLPAFTLPNAPQFNNLPVRNLKRASMMGLASGQAVARALGVTPLTNAQLDTNAANIAGGTHGLSNSAFGGQAPLWFYVNKESEIATGGRRLGPVGAAIVGEVIAGLLEADDTSFFGKLSEPFTPKPPIAPAAGQFAFADLLRFAGAL